MQWKELLTHDMEPLPDPTGEKLSPPLPFSCARVLIHLNDGTIDKSSCQQAVLLFVGLVTPPSQRCRMLHYSESHAERPHPKT